MAAHRGLHRLAELLDGVPGDTSEQRDAQEDDMSPYRRPELDLQTAEAMLDGCTGTPAGRDPVVDLLALAGAPPRPRELAGWRAALAAFRAAQQQPVPGADVQYAPCWP